jgi:ABC-2 type transport system ATP-binding protein
MASSLIDIQHLTKRYSGAASDAVNDLSLEVSSREVYGFLGPNGAGKSTTIKTLMGFLHPTSGSVRLLGQDSSTDGHMSRGNVGYLSGDMAMYAKMTGTQFLDYMGSLRAPKSAAYRNELCKQLDCSMHQPLGELSRGNRQKIALVQAFMSQPSALVLDEPTSGLDPLMQEVFYRLVGEARQRGACVFISSHILAEIQKTCDRVGIIKEGRLITEKSMAELAKEAAQTYTIRFGTKPPIRELSLIQGSRVVSSTIDTVVLQLNGSLKPLFTILAKHDTLAFDTKELDIESLFMHYYEETS